MSFDTSVFINCPFDGAYTPLLRSLVFTLLYLDLEPHVAQTKSSAIIRIDQIKAHIKNCKYSIHDLSRSKALAKDELPRFNMPYELGLDMGACIYGNKQLQRKKTLILETDKYHYQKVLSDISGHDIENHEDNPEIVSHKVRNWIPANSLNRVMPSASMIWYAYKEFYMDLVEELSPTYTRKEMDEIPIGDYIKFVKNWLVETRA